MNEKKERFTPGPWEVFFDDGDLVHVTTTGGKIISSHHGISTVDQANYLLEAAAPEMLEACREALSDLYYIGAKWKSVRLLETAIKKALGE
jgi:hypothetical protein